MQTHRHCLRRDRKGVLGTPLKLMIIMVILVASMPIVCSAVDMNKDTMMTAEMEQECGRIVDCARSVYHSGIGSSGTLEIGLPEGCEIRIGGEGVNAYRISAFYEGNEMSVTYMERPAVKFTEETVISGHCSLVLKCIGSGNGYALEVTVQ